MKKFKVRWIKALLPTVTSLLVVGCNYNDLKNPGVARNVSAGAPDSSNPVQLIDFETVSRLVLEPACTKCHGAETARAGLRLDTYASVFAAASEIRARVADGTMPPPPPRGAVLSPEQMSLLLAWIDSGAPEKVAVGEPERPDFGAVSQAVFQTHCLKCHSADAPRGGIDLETFSEVVKNSVAIESALRTDAMPLRAPPLSPELKEMVYAWILAGSPEKAGP